MDNFQIGIIGAGSIVELTHLPAIRVLDNVSTAWIYDNNAARMNKVAAMYGIPPLGDRKLEEAIAEANVCLLAIPYGVRKPYIELCRQHHKGLVIEKPFAFSVKEHEEYCLNFEEWQIGVNFQRRFYQSVGLLRKIISDNIFGKLQSIKLKHGSFALKGGSGFVSDVKLAGGGVIAESAVHNLDIILYITGARAVSLRNLRSFHRNGLDYDSVFESEINDGENNLPVRCEITTLRNLGNELQLQFSNAVVSCDLSPQGKIKVYNNGFSYTMDEALEHEALDKRATQVNEAFLVYWQQYLQGFRNKTVNNTHASRSLLTSNWLELIYRKIHLS
jgi:predicted dehydrogenase